MSDEPKNKMIMTVGTGLIFAFIFFALTFGMSEWKTPNPLTAQAPTPAPASTAR